MGGGIGVTPMLAMGHRLHAIGAEFELHYSAKSRESAGFLDDLERAAWRDRVHLHLSEDGSRADLDSILASYETGWHVYACGPERYMSAVMAAAGWSGTVLDVLYTNVTDPEARAQRNAKIVGIFTRLWRRDGKPQYLPHIPRLWRLLAGDLAHPALSEVRDWFDRAVPAALRRQPEVTL